MNWYSIEYRGDKSSTSVIGQTDESLEELLNSNSKPFFIKVTNVSYLSKISKKYELYEKWNSKWDNTIWVNTESVISIRRIKMNLLDKESTGEWNAFSDNRPFSLIISQQLLAEKGQDFVSQFKESLNSILLDKANYLSVLGEVTLIESNLLLKNEYIITQYGNVLKRGITTSDFKAEVLEIIDLHYTKQQDSLNQG
jgi:hypothetical protein